MNPKDKLRKLAQESGLEFEDLGRGHGHVKIRGKGVTVSCWPTSKKRAAYVENEPGQRRLHCTPQDIVDLALNAIAKQCSEHRATTERTRTNPAKLRHFYDGETTPWAFEGPMIMAESDRLRLEAWRLWKKAQEQDFLMEENS